LKLAFFFHRDFYTANSAFGEGKYMRRFFVEHIVRTGDLVPITGKEVNHIRNVLRMKEGDTLIIMDGKGHRFEARIEVLHRKGVKAKITKTLPALHPSPIEIHLAQALIKSHPMDFLIQKVTELGVSSISLFASERTAVKIKSEHLNHKLDHWKEIMKSACKQCGRATHPALHPPLLFEELIRNVPIEGILKILLWEAEERANLKNLLRSIEPLPHIVAAVGPEGGFTPKEVHLAREAGFSIVSLGNRVLRSETAAMSLISIIQYEWGDLNLKL
jgi:16S rRNA (uracil1498-N3)-methyltransferase